MERLLIEEKVREILSSQLSISAIEIREDSLIGGDLGADSLDTAEIAMMIKDEFGHDLTDQQIINIKTVKDIIDILSSSSEEVEK